MNNEELVIKILMTLVGFIILLKPNFLLFIQNAVNKVGGIPPMSSRVRPIFIRFMGLVVIILAIVF